MVFEKYGIDCYDYGDFCDEYGKKLGVIVHEYITVTYPKTIFIPVYRYRRPNSGAQRKGNIPLITVIFSIACYVSSFQI